MSATEQPKIKNIETLLNTEPPQQKVTDPEHAVQVFTNHVGQCYEQLAQLPKKSQRSVSEAQLATRLHQSSRQFKKWFMTHYSSWLYNILTHHQTQTLSLESLAFGASKLVPGLTPSLQNMSNDQACLQKDKEGFEIDQGIFFWGLLNNPNTGHDIILNALKPSPNAQALLDNFLTQSSLKLEKLHIEKVGHTAYLTIQNDAHLNAEDNKLIDNMETAIDLIYMDPSVRVAVMRGGILKHKKYNNKRIFSAGINLKHLHSGQISFTNFLMKRELGYINKIKYGLLNADSNQPWNHSFTEKPWIAVVDSFAIGGGMQILLVCDLIIAEKNSYFCLPAAQEGIIPGVANLRLTPIMGHKLTRQIVLQGKTIHATDAAASKFIDFVVEPEEITQTIQSCINKLDCPAVIGNRHMINHFDEGLETFRKYMADFSLYQSQRLYSDDVLDKINRWNKQ